VPTSEKRPEIPAMAIDKVKAASTVSSPPQKRFYETTPTRGMVRDVDEQEAANYTARHFGTTASLYLVKYIYDDDGEYLDTQYGIWKVDNVYMISNSNVTIDDASDIYMLTTEVSEAPKACGNC
jgi:hypothetical protein